MAKKMIKSKAQENWDNLIAELDYIHERITAIEDNTNILKTASNAVNFTLSAVLKLMIEKEIFTNEELDKMSAKIGRELKKQTKKQSEKLKKETKQTLYDALLKSDIGGNA